MSPRAYIVSMLASLVLFACGGAATQEEAKSPEGNPWASYTGKYAGPATSPSPSKAKVAETPAPAEEAAPADADAKALYGAPSEAKPAAKKAAAKKKPAAKKATAKKKPAAKKRGAKRAKR